MPILIIFVFIGCFGVYLFIKLRKSKMVTNLTHDLFDEPSESSVVINDISAAEQTLKATAKAQDAEAEKLQKDSAKIGDYLADRGVVKPNKGKEADGNEVVKGG